MNSSADPRPEPEATAAAPAPAGYPVPETVPDAPGDTGADAGAVGTEGEGNEYLASSNLVGFILAPAALVLVIVGLVWAFGYLTYNRSTPSDYALHLRSANKAERWQAALDLIETNSASSELLPIVLEMVDANDDDQSVTQIGWATSDLLKTPEERVVNLRWYAAAALGKIGGDQARDKLILLLTDKNDGVRFYSAHSLGRMGSREAVDPLVGVLNNDPDNASRMAAAWALGEIADPKAVEPLLAAFNTSTDTDVRRNSAVALTRFGKPAYDAYPKPTQDALDKVLVEMTNDDNPHTREQGRRALRLVRQYQKQS